MMPSLRFAAFAWAFTAAFCFPIQGSAGELESLIEEYNAAKPKAQAGGGGGGPGGKVGGKQGKGWGGGWGRNRAEDPVKLILMRIAVLGTPQAQAFIQGEFLKERPAIAVACVEPLLMFPGEKVVDVLLANWAKRDRTVKQEVLARLAASNRDLTPLEGMLVGLLQSEQNADVRRELPRLLAKIGTLSAIKALVSSLRVVPQPAQPPRFDPGKAWGQPPEEMETFERRVVTVLKDTKSDAVRAWLAGDAFSGAPPVRVEVLADLCIAMKLDAARANLEKNLESASESAALKCLEALVAIGAGPSEARIADTAKKWKHGIPFRVLALDTLAALGTPEAVAAIKAAAQDPAPVTRAVAMGSLALVPGASEEAVRAILGGLMDTDGSVRAAAFRALRKVRHREMVPALIDFLASEKDERLKVNALEFLVQITEKNMGLVVDDWRKWWEVTGPTFEFSTQVAERPVTAGKAQSLKYFGVEVSSKRVAFLIDASLSMDQEMDVYLRQEKKAEEGKTRAGGGGGGGPGGEAGGGEKSGPRVRAKRIDVLKREMVRVVSELPKDTLLNVITFAATYKPWQEALQSVEGGGREKVLTFVRGITMGIGTNVFDTLEFALKDRRVDTLFLLTDGEPRNGKYIDAPSILREVQALNRVRGATIHCIGFGEDSAFLKDLANQNGGVYRFVNSY